MARPGGNPDLTEYSFNKPKGVIIPRNKQFAIQIEPEIKDILRKINNEKIRKKFIELAIEEGYQIPEEITNYYDQLRLSAPKSRGKADGGGEERPTTTAEGGQENTRTSTPTSKAERRAR